MCRTTSARWLTFCAGAGALLKLRRLSAHLSLVAKDTACAVRAPNADSDDRDEHRTDDMRDDSRGRLPPRDRSLGHN